MIGKKLKMKTRSAITGYLFISLFIIGVVFIFIPGLVDAFVMSLEDSGDIFNPVYVGLTNYHWALFVDPDFIRDVASTIGSLLVDVLVISLFSLFISTLLNKTIGGKGVFRAIMFLPVVISTGVIAEYMQYNAATGSGIMQAAVSDTSALIDTNTIVQYIVSLNFSTELADVVVSAIENIYSIISRSGVQIVIFLAGLQVISPSIYEAAHIEGCTAWESFWKITLPIISPLISVNVVYTVVDSFASADNVVMERILQYITQDINYGHSTAMAFMYFAVIILILAAVLFVLNKFTVYTDS